MVKVADVVEELLQSSVAVKVTVADPVAPQPSLNALKSLVHTTGPLHTSEAAAPPLLANHAAKAAVLPAPSHSTVALLASVSMLGGVLS